VEERSDGALRWVGLFSFVARAAFTAAALRLVGLAAGPDGFLRLTVAVIGTAVALFAVARAGSWPRVLYLLAVGYLAYFAGGSGWRALWEVASVPADGAAETLAITFELATRLILKDVADSRYAAAFARSYDLAIMPLAQLVVLAYLARVLLKSR
jgi:hypothetical protein